jgi:hypothetical protein
MDDDLEPLLVEVRASTQGFAQDIASMRTTLDASLLGGFEQAGNVLERGLVGAIRRGSLGFDDLKRIALGTLDEIAAQAARSLFASLPGGGIGGLLNLGGLVGSVLGLPGRATGGPVSPGRGYLVGERGTELFVPTASGRVENFERGGGAGRDVRVSIAIAEQRGASAPQSLQRSSRQIASAVRRAITYA